MGERAKITLNEYNAKSLLKRDNLNLDSFYTSDLKTLIEVAQKEYKRLNNGIKELDNMFYETFRISQNGYYSISEWELKDFTDKLQELKGNDKK